MKKKLSVLFAALSITSVAFTQNVNIPDANFKAYLVNNSTINSNGDSEIQVSEANAYTGSIICTNLNISDITGIEAFVAITTLNCSDNQISSLDVTANTDLAILRCGNNLLTSIDVSNNPNLTIFNCSNNDIGSLNLSNNNGLTQLLCFDNQLTNIDLSGNTALTFMSASTNQLTDMDLSNLSLLTGLYCSSNNLTNLNIANNNNSNINNFNSSNNPNLLCIQHDPGFNPSLNSNWVKDANTSWSLNCDNTSDTIFVNINATGNNDGTSWTDAFTDATQGFLSANTADEIWIAQGTYVKNSTDRNTVFGWISDSVKVYGGFSGSGTETSVNERDWDAYPTIFSGDIGIIGDSTDNAYTVFIGPIGEYNNGPRITYASIDGIKIADGNASESSYPDYNTVGGGIVINTHTDYTVWNNIEIYNCYARQAAGVSFWNYQGTDLGTVEMNNFKIHDNVGRSCVAFQFRTQQFANIVVTITNSLFYNNHALEPYANEHSDHGTLGFFATSSSPLTAEVSNCTFYGNTAENSAEGLGVLRTYQAGHTGTLSLNNSIFYNNDRLDLTATGWQGQISEFTNVELKNNLLQNGHDLNTVNESNSITSDPLFTDATNNDFSLQSNSSAIDAGTLSNVTVPQLDLIGNPRIHNNIIDLGAIENQGPISTAQIKESENISVNIYPNPTNGLINIQTRSKIRSVSVFNSIGQMVMTSNLSQFSIYDLPTGVFFIKVETSEKTVTTKIIKQ
ncbi:MAG: T9SS type A sorting domain-containing protein [Crocinitomicaceae bacterium]